MIKAFVITWCSLFISSTTHWGETKFHCASTEYAMYYSTTTLVNKYNRFNARQKKDSMQFELNQIKIMEDYTIVYSTK